MGGHHHDEVRGGRYGVELFCCRTIMWHEFGALFADEAIPGENCDNATIVPPEIRRIDPIFERLIAQVWSDFQYKLNQEAELYGVQLDPFDVDAKLPEPIDLKQQGTGYSADVQMHGIKVGNFQTKSWKSFDCFSHMYSRCMDYPEST